MNGGFTRIKRSEWPQIKKFADIIHRAGYASPVRTPRGEDIMAACGQLKSETERQQKSKKKKSLWKLELKFNLNLPSTEFRSLFIFLFLMG